MTARSKSTRSPKIHEGVIAKDLMVMARVSDAEFEVTLKGNTLCFGQKPKRSDTEVEVVFPYGPDGTGIAKIAREHVIFS